VLGTLDARRTLGLWEISPIQRAFMRINFAARYKEVDNLLKASTKPLPESKDVAFEQDLGVLLLQDPETTVKSSEKQGIKSEPYLPLQSLKDPLEDIKASFRFPEPELQMTPLDPQKPRLEVSEQLTPSATPVKLRQCSM